MKIIRIAFLERCPHCSHSNDIDPEEQWVECESCGGGWHSYMHSKMVDEPRAFKSSPFAQGYDRRIRE